MSRTGRINLIPIRFAMRTFTWALYTRTCSLLSLFGVRVPQRSFCRWQMGWWWVLKAERGRAPRLLGGFLASRSRKMARKPAVERPCRALTFARNERASLKPPVVSSVVSPALSRAPGFARGALICGQLPIRPALGVTHLPFHSLPCCVPPPCPVLLFRAG